MAGFIEGVDRGQLVLVPDRLDDWIGEDSLVSVVDFLSKSWICNVLVSPVRLPQGLDGQAIILRCC